MRDDLQAATERAKAGDWQSGVVWPVICLAIGVYCIAQPHVILRGVEYAKLPQRSFGAACGLLFVAYAIGAHAYFYWGELGYIRVSRVGRLIGGTLALGAFAYILKCITEVSGWPW